MWKDLFFPSPLVGNWLASKIGKGNNVKVGLDPWFRSDGNYRLNEGLIEKLRQQGIIHLVDTAIQDIGNLWHYGWKDIGTLRLDPQDVNHGNACVNRLKTNYIFYERRE
jgi:hypothetical protein